LDLSLIYVQLLLCGNGTILVVGYKAGGPGVLLIMMARANLQLEGRSASFPTAVRGRRQTSKARRRYLSGRSGHRGPGSGSPRRPGGPAAAPCHQAGPAARPGEKAVGPGNRSMLAQGLVPTGFSRLCRLGGCPNAMMSTVARRCSRGPGCQLECRRRVTCQCTARDSVPVLGGNHCP
jgi:hypothetical protein